MDEERQISSGKYDTDAAALALRLRADGVVLIVFGGVRGEGMSISLTPAAYAAIRAHLPDILRRIASALEEENKPREDKNKPKVALGN